MILFAYLSGMSFVLAALALAVAIVEHYRAERAEQALRVVLAKDNAFHCRQNAARAVDIEKLYRANVEVWKAIQAVAAVSVPPVYPAGDQVQIVVPGPRTAQ